MTNVALFSGILSLIQLLDLTNEYLTFSVLMLTSLVMPIYSAGYELFERLPKYVGVALQAAGVASPPSILAIFATASRVELVYPYQVIVVFSSLSACTASVIGKQLSVATDFRSTWHAKKWAYTLSFTLLTLMVVATITHSHWVTGVEIPFSFRVVR